MTYRSLLLALALAAAPATALRAQTPTAAAASPFAGTWRYTATGSGGAVFPGSLTFTESAGRLAGSITRDDLAGERFPFEVLDVDTLGGIRFVFLEGQVSGRLQRDGVRLVGTAQDPSQTYTITAERAGMEAPKAEASPLVGRWSYSVEVPGQTVRGFLTFTAVRPDSLAGAIAQAERPDRTLPANNLVLDPDGTARFWLDAPGEVGRVDYAVRVSGPDRLGGTIAAMGYAFDLTGERAPSLDLPEEGVTSVAPVQASPDALAPATMAGNWQYTMDTPQGASSGRIELVQNADGTYGGRIVRGSGEITPFSSVTRDGNAVTLVYPSARYGTLTMALTFAGDAFSGRLLVGQTEIAVAGTRLPQ